jgi:hypothetical protein
MTLGGARFCLGAWVACCASRAADGGWKRANQLKFQSKLISTVDGGGAALERSPDHRDASSSSCVRCRSPLTGGAAGAAGAVRSPGVLSAPGAYRLLTGPRMAVTDLA